MENVTLSFLNYSLNSTLESNESSLRNQGVVALSTTQIVYQFLQVYILPIVICMGLIGNILSASAFLGKELRRISSSVYVIAVLSADTGVLISLLFVWLEALGYRYNHQPVMCQFLVYWSYICTFLSIWLVVCITIENYITICHPTRISSMCTVRRATIATISLTVFAVSIYAISIYTTTVQEHFFKGQTYPMCVPSPKYKTVIQLLTNIDTIITFLIPLVLIVFMLIAISLSILKSVRRKKMRRGNDTLTDKNRSKSIPQVRVAKMLYIMSVTFVILNVPSHAMRTYILFGPSSETWLGSEEVLIAQAVLQFIYYTNFAIKFLLFVSCSKNFRKSLCMQLGLHKNPYSAVSTSSATYIKN